MSRLCANALNTIHGGPYKAVECVLTETTVEDGKVLTGIPPEATITRSLTYCPLRFKELVTKVERFLGRDVDREFVYKRFVHTGVPALRDLLESAQFSVSLVLEGEGVHDWQFAPLPPDYYFYATVPEFWNLHTLRSWDLYACDDRDLGGLQSAYGIDVAVLLDAAFLLGMVLSTEVVPDAARIWAARLVASLENHLFDVRNATRSERRASP